MPCGAKAARDSIIITHGHFDHVFASARFKAETGAEIVMHPDDLSLLAECRRRRAFSASSAVPPNPDRLVREGDTVTVGKLSLGVLETPGTRRAVSPCASTTPCSSGYALRRIGGEPT